MEFAWQRAVAAAVLSLAMAGPAVATEFLSFRALGWYRGKADISEGQIKCEIPTTDSAIADGAFSMSLWNTFGIETLYFPDVNHPYGNPCGGYVQFRNGLAYEGLNLEKVRLKYAIPGARRLREAVPVSRNFPTTCRDLRRPAVYLGGRMDPATSTTGSSGSGSPNVTFVQINPMVSTDVIECLHDVYGNLPTEVYSSMPLVIYASATAISDTGERYRSNTIRYTLTLRHTCGNGRVDDGEICDPSLSPTCNFGPCEKADPMDATGTCAGDDRIVCAADVDCVLQCQAAGEPTECTCQF